MEAASSGIPLIATRVGGNPEIVDEACGRLLPADPTPSELATALAEIAFLTPDDCAATRAASRDRWSTDFCAERNYRAFGELLGSVAAQ
jgi:glycosyltransferase involved in cell wall biosynthesis